VRLLLGLAMQQTTGAHGVAKKEGLPQKVSVFKLERGPPVQWCAAAPSFGQFGRDSWQSQAIDPR